MLAEVLASTNPRTPRAPESMYSMASHPPHDWPSRCTCSRPRARLTVSTSSTKRSIFQSEGSSSLSERPQPSWFVVDDRAVLRERFEGLQIIVARSRPAVQGQERYCAFTDAAVPDPVAIYLDSAFFAFQAGFSPLPTFPNRSFGPAVYIKRTGMESCIRGSDRGGVSNRSYPVIILQGSSRQRSKGSNSSRTAWIM